VAGRIVAGDSSFQRHTITYTLTPPPAFPRRFRPIASLGEIEYLAGQYLPRTNVNHLKTVVVTPPISTAYGLILHNAQAGTMCSYLTFQKKYARRKRTENPHVIPHTTWDYCPVGKASNGPCSNTSLMKGKNGEIMQGGSTTVTGEECPEC
jgi:hypothetical protein